MKFTTFGLFWAELVQFGQSFVWGVRLGRFRRVGDCAGERGSGSRESSRVGEEGTSGCHGRRNVRETAGTMR